MPAASASTSPRRRSANGSSIRSSSAIASRSNATNETGVCSASIRTRLSAGWMRCCSASKSSRPSVTRMISPSTTQRGGRFCRRASTSSGKYRVIGRSLRLPSSISSPSLKTIVRKPSHFGSTWPTSGISFTDFDSIGARGGITGRSIRPSCCAGRRLRSPESAIDLDDRRVAPARGRVNPLPTPHARAYRRRRSTSLVRPAVSEESTDERPRPHRSEGGRRTRCGGRAAAERHQRAEEDADADEHVVIRDPETGDVAEEPAQ